MGGGGSETATLAMSRLYVGKYQLGSDHVKVFLRSGDGGDGYILPPSITIGADVKSWKTVFGALMHEAFEIVLTKNNLRYSPDQDWSNESSAYLFVMAHNQMGDCNMRVACFMDNITADFKRAWLKWKKEKKK